MTRRRKPRVGRPRLGATARSVPIRVWVTPALAARIGAAAKAAGVPLTGWGVAAFERALGDLVPEAA